MLRRLAQAGVDFVIIGGVAVIAQAYPRTTDDLDICYSLDQENLDRLGATLLEVNARLRGIDAELPFVPDGRTLRRTTILTLDTDEGPIDLLVEPTGSPPYDQLKAAADRVDVDDVEVLVASLDDLIAMKQAAGRPRDLADLEALETAKRLRRRA